MLELLIAANAVEENAGGWRSRVRYATLGPDLFVHSGYPTTADNSVFFGPDTYRFVSFIGRELQGLSSTPCVFDIGTGSGVGGIHVARALAQARVVVTDINERALEYAAVNARLAAVTFAASVVSDVLKSVEGDADLIICNPPYMADSARRMYRDGGGDLGSALSLRIMKEASRRLNPGGRLLLYTGAAIVRGRDVFGEACRAWLTERNATFRYEEIDPDVFSEQLTEPQYADVERIAAVGLVVHAQGSPYQ